MLMQSDRNEGYSRTAAYLHTLMYVIESSDIQEPYAPLLSLKHLT